MQDKLGPWADATWLQTGFKRFYSYTFIIFVAVYFVAVYFVAQFRSTLIPVTAEIL